MLIDTVELLTNFNVNDIVHQTDGLHKSTNYDLLNHEKKTVSKF